MFKIDPRKVPVGEISPEEQKKFKEIMTGKLELGKMDMFHRGMGFNYKLAPEVLSVIEHIDFRASVEHVVRSYYPRGAESVTGATAHIILIKGEKDRDYSVVSVYKNIKSDMTMNARTLDITERYLNFIINSPVLGIEIVYFKGDLTGFEFDAPASKLIDKVYVDTIVKYGGDSYTTESGEQVDFKPDKDPEYIRVTAIKGNPKRVIKVPIHVDFTKIREEIEEGLDLEDPYNSPPGADEWRKKDLEKVVGIIEVPKDEGEIKLPR